MGLDMFLLRKVKGGNKKLEIYRALTNGDQKEEVAYWRKENWLHKWFFDNCKMIDETAVEVSEEQLKKLIEVIEQVLGNPAGAAELLPPQSGFFFGDTDIDKYYFKCLKKAKLTLTKVLEDTDFTKEQLEYYASW